MTVPMRFGVRGYEGISVGVARDVITRLIKGCARYAASS
jgi:hypothetical protein